MPNRPRSEEEFVLHTIITVHYLLTACLLYHPHLLNKHVIGLHGNQLDTVCFSFYPNLFFTVGLYHTTNTNDLSTFSHPWNCSPAAAAAVLPCPRVFRWGKCEIQKHCIWQWKSGTPYRRRPRRPPFRRVESDGIGVTSSMRPIFIDERARARRADWAPGPGVLVRLPPVARSLMCRAVIPSDLHFSATSCEREREKQTKRKY